jgi:hypothetical protein
VGFTGVGFTGVPPPVPPAPKVAPQFAQNFAPSSFANPQFGQYMLQAYRIGPSRVKERRKNCRFSRPMRRITRPPNIEERLTTGSFDHGRPERSSFEHFKRARGHSDDTPQGKLGGTLQLVRQSHPVKAKARRHSSREVMPKCWPQFSGAATANRGPTKYLYPLATTQSRLPGAGKASLVPS